MVVGDEPLHIVQGLKVLENAILEHSVELVLNRSQHCGLLVDINAKLLERLIPVELVQIKDLEPVNDLAHASLHFGVIEERLVGKQVILGQLLSCAIEPRVTSFISAQNKHQYYDLKLLLDVTYLRGKARMAGVARICMLLFTRLRPLNIIFAF